MNSYNKSYKEKSKINWSFKINIKNLWFDFIWFFLIKERTIDCFWLNFTHAQIEGEYIRFASNPTSRYHRPPSNRKEIKLPKISIGKWEIVSYTQNKVIIIRIKNE